VALFGGQPAPRGHIGSKLLLYLLGTRLAVGQPAVYYIRSGAFQPKELQLRVRSAFARLHLTRVRTGNIGGFFAAPIWFGFIVFMPISELPGHPSIHPSTH
jgi:hypothetical protein